MNKIGIILINILAFLPLPILYIISDYILYPVIRYVIRYRHNVIEKNIALAFPQKNDTERKNIKQAFYHNICDILVETIRMRNMSPDELKRRFRWDNINEVIPQSNNKSQYTLCYVAHYGNWEWAIGRLMPNNMNKTMYIYNRLHNQFFDKWIHENRSRYGIIPVEMSSVSATLRSLKTEKCNYTILVAIDQLPKEQYVKHFQRFLGIKTKVITGTEQLINNYRMNVYYCSISRIKRGYYYCHAKHINIPQELTGKGKWPYTDTYFRHLQQQIYKQPALWLWSHDRWRR